MTLEHVFTDENKKRIHDAVARAEARTSGEIVPVVVEASDGYPHVTLAAAVVGQMVALAAGVWVFPEPGYLVILSLIAGGMAAGTFLGRFVTPLRRLLLGQAITETEVYQRALQAFHELGVADTRDRTGILIFVSILEKRVQVLGDLGISEKASDSTWDEVVEKVLDGIGRSDLVGGLVDAIDACGVVLAKHFPPSADDVNELSDDVMIN
jgi:putative membrane protein